MVSEAQSAPASPTPASAAPARPDFVVLGGHRCATTSLHHYLGQHPQIFLPSRKGTDYFTNAGRTHGPGEFPVATTLDEYEGLFKPARQGQIRGEVSSVYLHNPVARALRDALPHAKLIAVLRHPIERAYSHFLAVRRWQDHIDFADLLQPEFVAPSRYDSSLGHYDAELGRGQVEILLYDDLESDPQRFFARLFRVIGVATDFAPDMSTRHHLGGIPKSRTALRLLSEPNRLARIVNRFVPESARVRQRAARATLIKPPVPPEIAEELRRQLRDETLALQERIGRDLGHWLH